MANPTSNGEAIDNALEHERPVKALLRLTETAAFLRSTDGCFHARVQVGGRPEIYALGSPPFRSYLLDRYEDSPLTDILLELAPHKLDWIRTASDLLAELTTWAGKRVTASPRWPKTPRSLATHLRRIAPPMRMHGVSMTFLRTREKRFIEIISTKPPIPEESPHVSVSGIESCSDKLIHGDPDAAQIHATA